MNLQELLDVVPSPWINPPLGYLRGLALILSPELNATLEAVQSQLPPRTCVVRSMPLVDGTYMLGADLLTEIGPGGLYAQGFGQLPAEAFPAVQVVPMADALALIPPPPPEF